MSQPNNCHIMLELLPVLSHLSCMDSCQLVLVHLVSTACT